MYDEICESGEKETEVDERFIRMFVGLNSVVLAYSKGTIGSKKERPKKTSNINAICKILC